MWRITRAWTITRPVCHLPRFIPCNGPDFQMPELKTLTYLWIVSFGGMKSVLVVGLFLIVTSHGFLQNLGTSNWFRNWLKCECCTLWNLIKRTEPPIQRSRLAIPNQLPQQRSLPNKTAAHIHIRSCVWPCFMNTMKTSKQGLFTAASPQCQCF